MKTLFFSFLFSMALFKCQAQAFEVEQLALDISKLAQLKSILSDLYKGYEILDHGYTAIKNLSEGNFNLHQAFLDALLAVSPAVRNYKKVADIIEDQGRLVSEYKSAFSRFSADKHFTPDEILYFGQVYANLFNRSVQDIDHLVQVLTAGLMRMSDDERLHAIDGIYRDSKEKLDFLRQFNNQTTLLAVQRSVDDQDMETLKGLYGL
jgi:hypothetical protein